MRYHYPTAKIVTGFFVAYVSYVVGRFDASFSEFIIFSTIVLCGCILLVHGLFTGLEEAVKEGRKPANERKTTSGSER